MNSPFVCPVLVHTDGALIPSVELAELVSEYAHLNQRRRTADGPVPYFTHPERVAARASSWLAKTATMEAQTAVIVVGLLHDVAEDQLARAEDYVGDDFFAWTADAFGPDVTTALRALTHGEGQDYSAYLARALANELGALVKVADFFDNALDLCPDQPRYEKLHAKYQPHVSAVRGAVDTVLRDVLDDADELLRRFDAAAHASGFVLA